VKPLRSLPLLLLAPAFAASGCFGGRHCVDDSECASDSECTRTGECVALGSALRVVLRWTVDGAAPTPSAPEPCAGISELEILFHDASGDIENYRPVPCPLGRATYDKMPPRFRSVELVAYDDSGFEIDSVEEPLSATGATDVLIDLHP
jgi:hypothetical protein